MRRGGRVAEELTLPAATADVVLAEAAVAYAYSVAGPRLAPPEQGEARSLYSAHEQARDDALVSLTDAGEPPIEIPTFFALPGPVTTTAQASELLATVESRLATTYADLIAVTSPQQRQPVLDQVLLATTRSLRWGASPGAWGAAEPAAATPEAPGPSNGQGN
jgi:hypothetical protein